jgi:hypothetical protein
MRSVADYKCLFVFSGAQTTLVFPWKERRKSKALSRPPSGQRFPLRPCRVAGSHSPVADVKGPRVGSGRSAGLRKGHNGREPGSRARTSRARPSRGATGRVDEGRGPGPARHCEVGVTLAGWLQGRPGGANAEPHPGQQLTQPRPSGVDPHDPPPAPAPQALQHVQREGTLSILHHLLQGCDDLPGTPALFRLALSSSIPGSVSHVGVVG